MPCVFGLQAGVSPSTIYLNPDDRFYIISSNDAELSFNITAVGISVSPSSGVIKPDSRIKISARKDGADPGMHFIHVETTSNHGTIGVLPALIVKAEVEDSLFKSWHVLVISVLVMIIGVVLLRRL